jgi:hypothetical protein
MLKVTRVEDCQANAAVLQDLGKFLCRDEMLLVFLILEGEQAL